MPRTSQIKSIRAVSARTFALLEISGFDMSIILYYKKPVFTIGKERRKQRFVLSGRIIAGINMLY
ncbi:MAG: hypothetical protein A2Z46_01115 [Nitrospirae bacterium RBG_19FT_COMBO_55_12]|nr:MAG: hypothetical protein A2Z46_01115 [Nitrospirae bacterium RBG_19FT_COMBO_55_12]